MSQIPFGLRAGFAEVLQTAFGLKTGITEVSQIASVLHAKASHVLQIALGIGGGLADVALLGAGWRCWRGTPRLRHTSPAAHLACGFGGFTALHSVVMPRLAAAPPAARGFALYVAGLTSVAAQLS